MSLTVLGNNAVLSELIIMNALIFDETSRDDIIDQLVPEHFNDPSNQRAYRDAVDDIKDNKDILNEQWVKRYPPGKFKNEGHIHWKTAIKTLKDQKTRRDLYITGTTLINNLSKNMSLDKIEADVDSIIDSYRNEDVIKDKSIKQLVEENQGDNSRNTIPWGLKTLDKYPLENGNLVVIGARPSIGKTSIVCTLLLRMSLMDVGVGIINLEMTEAQITDRLLSQLSGIPYPDIKAKLLKTKTDIQCFNESQEELKKLKIMAIKLENSNSKSIKEVIKKWHRKENIKVVFIDYLQKIRMPKADRHDLAIGFFTSMLKDIALKLDIAVVLLVQLNRDAENKVPSLHNLKDSGRIEEDADIVILLHRERDKSSSNSRLPTFDTKKTMVLIEKNRNGRVGMEKIDFKGETMTFTECEKEREHFSWESQRDELPI